MADPLFKELAYTALAQTARNPTQDFLRATPRNPVLGYLSDLAASSYAPQRTQQMQGIAQFLGIPAISQTLDRLSYGEPLTTGSGGIGGTSRLRPETIEAALAISPFLPKGIKMTEGLPVGASIKNVGKTDLVTGLPLNSDGTVTLFHHTNKTAAEQIAKSGRLKSAGEPSVYLTTEKATTTGYGDVAVPVRVKPSLLNLDDEFPSGRMDFSIDTGKPKGSVPVIVEKQSFQAPQQAALDLAQQRAALPIEQGGLGLPATNTAADRAKAMGFDDKTWYHGTNADITKFDPKKSAQGGITWIAENPQYSADYASRAGGNVIPLQANLGKQAGWKEYDNLGIDELAGRGYNSAYLPDAEESVAFVMKPEQLRSRFAAFDPFRKTAATAATMGVAAPDLLAQENPSISDAEQQARIMLDIGQDPYTIYQQTGIWLGGNE